MNRLEFDLKTQYQDHVSFLRGKIQEQEKEIENLEILIKLLSHEKEYDC
jgi:hypothetical protein